MKYSKDYQNVRSMNLAIATGKNGADKFAQLRVARKPSIC